jgi:glycosyltransferase involved in cell wall biosynthesis
MTTPRLTIGVPVYNGAATLRRALASIDAQTFRDFKVVIADNKSTDETASIAAEFAAGRGNVEIISREATVPAFTNFSSLALAAETELFVWLADDDWWEPEFLEACVAALDRNTDARHAFTHFRQYFHFNDQFGASTAHVPSLSWDKSLNAIIRSADMAPCSFYGVFRSWDIKEALREHNLQFDFSDVFLTIVMALRGQLEIVPRDLYRSGVRSEAAAKRTSLDGSKLKYRPFLKATTKLLYASLPRGRATLAAVNLWWRVRELRRHHSA